MITVGITGGIGAGKSLSARLLVELGLSLVDTDDLAREQVLPGSGGYQQVVEAFGTGILATDGQVDRKRLAGVVFNDPSARSRLEGILHPRIHEAWNRWLGERRNEGCPAAFVVIPLLFEKGYGPGFDTTVTVACSPETQQVRLRGRGWTVDDMHRRLAAQMPMTEKIRSARFVVWNEGTEGCLRDQWLRILRGFAIPSAE